MRKRLQGHAGSEPFLVGHNEVARSLFSVSPIVAVALHVLTRAGRAMQDQTKPMQVLAGRRIMRLVKSCNMFASMLLGFAKYTAGMQERKAGTQKPHI